MDRKVVSLNRSPKLLAHYLRLGHGCHRQLEELHDAGDLPFDRVVVDAARCTEQRDLLRALSQDGKEIVLDPNMAELSTVGGVAGQARRLPWARNTGFWRPEDMDEKTCRSAVNSIAEVAVEAGCSAVQSPSHLLLHGPNDPWLGIDLRAAELLRSSLDTLGGKNISVDYVLSINYATLRDPEARRVIINELSTIPFDHLWLRIPNFGVNSTGAMVRQYVSAVSDILERLGPQSIIADYAGGLPALAVCAFGAAGGIAHGVAEKKSFNPSLWIRPRSSSFGGRRKRIYVPNLGHYLTDQEFKQLWDVSGARSMLVCPDPSCCGRGKKHMVEKRHVLRQRARQLEALSRIPELSRPEHFVHKQVEDVGRAVRSFERLRGLDQLPNLKKKVSTWSAQIDRLSGQLKQLMELRGALARSAEPRLRGSAASASNWS